MLCYAHTYVMTQTQKRIFYFYYATNAMQSMLAFRIYEYTSEDKFKIPHLKGIYLIPQLVEETF